MNTFADEETCDMFIMILEKKWGDFKRDSLDLNLLGKYREDAIKIFDKTGWK